MSQSWGKKTPWETRSYTMNFAKLMNTGEKVTSTTSVSITVVEGVDPSPASMISGALSIDSTGLLVSCTLTGGLDGVTYKVSYKVNTNITEGVEGIVLLPVTNNP